MARTLAIAGYICFGIVVLVYIAERFAILPSMGWGLADSPGYYLNLASAIAGIVFLFGSFVLRRRPG